MVRKTDDLFVCEECGMMYLERKWAERCERFCKKYHSCSTEITKHAVGVP